MLVPRNQDGLLERNNVYEEVLLSRSCIENADRTMYVMFLSSVATRHLDGMFVEKSHSLKGKFAMHTGLSNTPRNLADEFREEDTPQKGRGIAVKTKTVTVLGRSARA